MTFEDRFHELDQKFGGLKVKTKTVASLRMLWRQFGTTVFQSLLGEELERQQDSTVLVGTLHQGIRLATLEMSYSGSSQIAEHRELTRSLLASSVFPMSLKHFEADCIVSGE